MSSETPSQLPSFEARFASAHAGDADREAAQRAQWQREMDNSQLQMQAMEESISLLEREVKNIIEKLAAAQREAGGSSTAADLELLLGQLEDKLLCTQHELAAARRLWYFPAPDGFKLRFSYQDNFLGFKELIVEQLRGTARLHVGPGIAADGTEQPPSVRLVWEGHGEGVGKEPGGLLRFLGEGLSMYSRREMLGVALSPNLTLERMDVSARFLADIPLVYSTARRAWRLERDFRIELLHFRTEASHDVDTAAGGGVAATASVAASAAQEAMVRFVLQSALETVTRQLIVRRLGPTLGEYLRTTRHGAELVLEVDVRGISVRRAQGVCRACAGRVHGVHVPRAGRVQGVCRVVRVGCRHGRASRGAPRRTPSAAPPYTLSLTAARTARNAHSRHAAPTSTQVRTLHAPLTDGSEESKAAAELLGLSTAQVCMQCVYAGVGAGCVQCTRRLCKTAACTPCTPCTQHHALHAHRTHTVCTGAPAVRGSRLPARCLATLRHPHRAAALLWLAPLLTADDSQSSAADGRLRLRGGG